jgi:hypothetical protein
MRVFLRRPLVGLALCFVTATVGGEAFATTVVARSFAELCVEADTIFVGTVDDVRSQRVEGSGGSIETLVRFSRLEVLAGVPRAEITLRFSGGEVDGVREEVIGVPRFARGERVVLFVRDRPAVSPVVGFHQGDFRVLAGASGEIVLPGDGATLPAGDGGGGAAGGMPLDEFRRRIGAELRQRGSRP